MMVGYAIIGHSGDGELGIFIPPLPSSPGLDGFSWSSISCQITLWQGTTAVASFIVEDGAGQELLKAGYALPLLVFEQDGGGDVVREWALPLRDAAQQN